MNMQRGFTETRRANLARLHFDAVDITTVCYTEGVGQFQPRVVFETLGIKAHVY